MIWGCLVFRLSAGSRDLPLGSSHSKWPKHSPDSVKTMGTPLGTTLEFVYRVLTKRPCSSVSEVLLAEKTAGEALGARHSDALPQGAASLCVCPLACRR